ncbi:hypothetical protein [uncultured Hyphomicrobium sp.]|uniref:hypothetical protein n=1 Tax=uncultured Hyphomicrobium sp. TaxID=194373 RepID=UPI0025E00D4E|nr:hypothetical protein [uncultured Hyphomicrobium sp.]
MTILLVQTFLLMLGAFLLGASLACLIRRGFTASRDDAVSEAAETALTGVAVAAPPAVVVAAETDRFGRALSGGQDPGVPPVLAGQPVIEVQPKPVSAPAPQPVTRPAPQSAPQAAPSPSPAPPQRVVLPPAPAPAPQPKSVEPAPVVRPAPAPAGDGESYTQIAVAAAAMATAAKLKAEADAAAAQKAAEARAPAPGPADDDGPSRFGTPAEVSPLERGFGDAVDDLTRIRGIDTDLKERLVRYGVHRFSQIAEWTPDDVRAVNQTLGFQGRVERENWVEQAGILAAGGSPAVALKSATVVAGPVPVDGDRLHRIIGVDPQSEAVLRANGISQLDQIASWSAADVTRFEGLIGSPGRIAHESWVEQALFLTGRAPPAPEPEVISETPAPPAGAQVAPVVVSAPRVESYSGLRSVKSEALRGDGFGGISAGPIDDLKRIRGIGVLIEKKLNSLGITAYEQVANWTRGDIDRMSQILDFKGRIERENWIEQARILASGGQTEFSRRVDRGEA